MRYSAENVWKDDISNHSCFNKLKNAELRNAEELHDFLSENFLPEEVLCLLVQLPKFVDAKKALPAALNQFMFSQKHLALILKMRIEYVVKAFVVEKGLMGERALSWLISHIGPLSKLDKSLRDRKVWVEVM